MENTATEETVLTEIIEAREESMKGIKSGTGKGVPKPLKPKSKEEITEMANNRHMEKTNAKDISEQQNEGFMTAIQKQHRRTSVREILQSFAAQRKDICQKPLKGTTEEEVTAIILRWILDNLPAERSVLMRSRDDDGDVFELQIRKHRRCIYAKSVRHLRNAKRLYLWRKGVTYTDLTIEEIEKSVRRAEEKDKRN